MSGSGEPLIGRANGDCSINEILAGSTAENDRLYNAAKFM